LVESVRIEEELGLFMKAVVRERYGSHDVLELTEMEKPTPKGNEVLVRIHAVSINKADLYQLHPPFLIRLLLGGGARIPKSKTFGSDVAGRVEAVGGNVRHFRPGDEVFGCGRGAFAEFVIAREENLVPKPASATFEESAAVPVAAITALQGLRKAGVQPGQKVLIDGASGGVGTFAVQIAKSMGAEVTAVCSTKNLDNARAMGADHDLIVGVNGYRSLLSYRRALSPKGMFVLVGSHRPLTALFQMVLFGPLISKLGSRKMSFMGIAKLNQEDFPILKELLEAGKIKPLIDRRYPLSEAAEAFRYFEEGHARGKVVITIA